MKKAIIFTLCRICTGWLLPALLLFAVPAQSQHMAFRQLTLENGLSQNSVMAIAQDSRGFMWFGTRYGLNRYDGIRFKVYNTVEADTTSVSNNSITALLSDSEGRLWIGTATGLNRYNEQSDRFERVVLEGKKDSYISYLYEDRHKRVWVGAGNGIHLLTGTGQAPFSHRFPFFSKQNKPGNYIRVIFGDTQDRLWIGSSSGLVCITDPTGTATYIIYKHSDADPGSLSADYVTTVVEDRQHRIWAGTLHNGINRLDAATQTFRRFEPESNVRKMVVDHSNRLWIGTQDGLTLFDPVTEQSLHYQHEPENSKSLSNNSIHQMFEDRSGNMWIGTYHGGINLSYASSNRFAVYQNNRSASSISNNVISAVIKADEGHYWVGTEGGGLNYFDRRSGTFTSYRHNPKDPSTISSNLIKVLLKDSRGNIWIGTSYSAGLNVFNPATRTFRRISTARSDQYSASFDEILALAEDAQGTIWIGSQSGLTEIRADASGNYPPVTTYSAVNRLLKQKNIHTLYTDSRHQLWIGTAAGLYCYDPLSQQLHSFFRGSGKGQLVNDNINTITEDSRGRLLLGTFYGGLSLYNRTTGQFSVYTGNASLPNSNVLGITEDEQHNLWLSTDNGLVRLTPDMRDQKNYTTSDGLAGNKFSANALLKDRNGDLYFGGNNGLTVFNPAGIVTNTATPSVLFTGLDMLGRETGTADALQGRNIGTADELVFKHGQSNFTIHYALLNYTKPEKNRYAYMLQGIDNSWNYVTATSATYTNLPAGTYTLLVKAANNDGVWSARQAKIRITILPPFWKTWWAYSLYLLAFAGIVFFVLRFFWLRALFKREHELQQFKLNFFTNISHEIRTHLTLISGPVEKMLARENPVSWTTQQLQHVKSNADRLMNLVGELMDFRKAETNNLALHVTQENLIAFVNDIFASFRDLALARNMQLLFTPIADELPVYLDKRQMEKVLFNLLTNAFKFTPDGGRIEVAVTEQKNDVCILVTDNGKGIAPENLKNLFLNFFQVEDQQAHNTGYGIGLALSKSIVALHKGTLTVESVQPAEGQAGQTTFTVTLQKGSSHFTDSQLLPPSRVLTSLQQHLSTVGNQAGLLLPQGQKPTLLLVEDNEELRAFVRQSLEEQYTILESNNGAAGYALATEKIPDLVISDVMMPEMDGMEFCTKLKQDARTSHIPVILLTAKASAETQLEGLEHGADAYITKPFSMQVLELQVRNLVAARLAIRQQYMRQTIAAPKQVAPPTVDEAFLEEVIAIVEEHMDNPDFSVALLATKVAMSQPVLYRKLKALTDLTVNDFIKSIRLKKAAQLLLQKQLNVTEVAYAVGFSRRKHFTEEFKKQFGITPSEYAGTAVIRNEKDV
jgi:ligand-binding sensor domain-containing protein/signal transduction histidine kinase/DNA-binding response OmpR family regulator